MACLLSHLRTGMTHPFDRAAGVDCCLWPADWIVLETGIDPAAELRGTYTNAAGALRQIQRFGGFETMWRVCMARAGFQETADPVEGDVGVVVDAAGHLVSAVRVHAAWAAKSARGLVIEDFEMRAAWSLRRG